MLPWLAASCPSSGTPAGRQARATNGHLVQEPDLLHKARRPHQPAWPRCKGQGFLPRDPAPELSGSRLGGVLAGENRGRDPRLLVEQIDLLPDEPVEAVRERAVLVVEPLRDDGDQERMGAEVAVAPAEGARSPPSSSHWYGGEVKCASIWPVRSACISSGWSIEISDESRARAFPSFTSAIFLRTTAWIEVAVGVAIRFPRRSANVLIEGFLTMSQRSASSSGAITFQFVPRAQPTSIGPSHRADLDVPLDDAVGDRRPRPAASTRL